MEEGLRGREVYERGGGREEGFCNFKKKEVKEGKRIGLRRRGEGGREGEREGRGTTYQGTFLEQRTCERRWSEGKGEGKVV